VDGSLGSRRKSPRKGSIYDLFNVLVYAWELPLQKKLSVELVLVDALEKRVQDGKGSWHHAYASIHDKLLTAWNGTVALNKAADYRQFVPFKRGQEWKAADFAKAAKIRPRLAGKALYVLTRLSVIEQCGLDGRAFIYKTKY
jgi:hypothetical protein